MNTDKLVGILDNGKYTENLNIRCKRIGVLRKGEIVASMPAYAAFFAGVQTPAQLIDWAAKFSA